MFAMVGCATLLVVGSVSAWVLRDQLAGVYAAFTGDPAPELEITGPGMPSSQWARSAERKREAMARFLGPESVDLNSAEVASMILEDLPPIALTALDSIRVTLEPDRFVFEAQLRTDIWGREIMGPFAGVLRPREDVRAAGPATVDRPGVIAWMPDQFSIRNIPIPGLWIPFVVNSVTGGTDGRFLLAAPATIRDMRITADRVTFYRRVQ